MESTENQQSIDALRCEINTIDQQIMTLIAQRARVAQKIGHLKGNTAVYRPERERCVIDGAVAAHRRAQGLISDKAVSRIVLEIMSACRAVEGRPTVAYLGPEGTFTEMAVYAQFGHDVTLVDCPTLPEVFRACSLGQSQFAVVPVENSTEGSVTQTMDLLLTTDLQAVGEVYVPVVHNLMTKAKDLASIKTVCAHPQALAQCRQWLQRYLPHCELQPRSSNAEAACQAKDDSTMAAIAAERAAEIYDLSILAQGIQDDVRNATRFLVLGKQAVGCESQIEQKTSIVFSVPNKAGALLEALQPLTLFGVSMTRLESRPARNGAWDYNFFVDIEGHQSQPCVQQAIEAFASRTTFFKVIGSYPTAKRYAG